MDAADKKRTSKADTRIIQLGATAPDSVDKDESDEKTFQTEHRGKKRTPIAVQRDDDDDYR